MVKVTIGVPTYNGASYISECLETLINQDFEDFTVIISDNASTDGTSDICSAFAAKDRRFQHLRSAETCPAIDNFRRCLTLSNTEFFMWRADDDIAEKNYLSGLVAAMDRSPDAGLAVSRYRRQRIGTSYDVMYDLVEIEHDDDKQTNVEKLLLGCKPAWFYGLWRQDEAERGFALMQRYPHLWAWDHLLMLPAILNGRVALAYDAGAFIQRQTKKDWYRPLPSQLLTIRREYKAIAEQLLAEATLDQKDRQKLRRALSEHICLRVAPLRPTYRRFMEELLLKLIGREYKWNL